MPEESKTTEEEVEEEKQEEEVEEEEEQAPEEAADAEEGEEEQAAEEEEEKDEEEQEEEAAEEEEEGGLDLEKGDVIKFKEKRKKKVATVVEQVEGNVFKVKVDGKTKKMDLSKVDFTKAKKKVARVVEKILAHKRVGHTMSLKCKWKDASLKPSWVLMENMDGGEDELATYKEAFKKDIEARNKDREERRNAKKEPESKSTRRGRSVKRVNYSSKGLREAYQPVSSDSEDDFEVAEQVAARKKRRDEMRAEKLAQKKKRGRKRRKTAKGGRKKRKVAAEE